MLVLLERLNGLTSVNTTKIKLIGLGKTLDGSVVDDTMMLSNLKQNIKKGVWNLTMMGTPDEELAKMETPSNQVLLDGLVCNAGALLNEKTLTSEGVEVTFAAHLLFGVYLLGKLSAPYLEATEGSRLVVISSGGMYNTNFPAWDVATSTGNKKYDGQLAYAYAKRGQVLLCEKWSELYPSIKIVTAHPGWTLTEVYVILIQFY